MGEARRKRQAEREPEPPVSMRQAVRRVWASWLDFWHDRTGPEQIVLAITLILIAVALFLAFVLGETATQGM
jgi:hypothetical protein